MATGSTDRVPFGVDVLRTEGDVGVGGAGPQPICLADLLDLTLDAQDGTPLSVSLRQCCLELLMCCQQTLRATGRQDQPAAPTSCRRQKGPATCSRPSSGSRAGLAQESRPVSPALENWGFLCPHSPRA